ncbi:hypothetical protein SADUNF_Sadunf13G0023500 [Salix dunnii]|uniref:Uncharacterized protein n=1 Tax=Salix dunnii TaxID=1413687 RepID=A0A835JIP0_9ROSI|nr:hypothetical protein SADUNF_Sadunf13G0023500 [Salix dunnii]
MENFLVSSDKIFFFLNFLKSFVKGILFCFKPANLAADIFITNIQFGKSPFVIFNRGLDRTSPVDFLLLKWVACDQSVEILNVEKGQFLKFFKLDSSNRRSADMATSAGDFIKSSFNKSIEHLYISKLTPWGLRDPGVLELEALPNTPLAINSNIILEREISLLASGVRVKCKSSVARLSETALGAFPSALASQLKQLVKILATYASCKRKNRSKYRKVELRSSSQYPSSSSSDNRTVSSSGVLMIPSEKNFILGHSIKNTSSKDGKVNAHFPEWKHARLGKHLSLKFSNF